jgi:hypothetical protein
LPGNTWAQRVHWSQLRLWCFTAQNFGMYELGRSL